MSTVAYTAKKLISAVLYPLGFSLLLSVTGILFWRRRPSNHSGFLIISAGILWLLVMSLPLTGFLLLRPLEIQAGEHANPRDLASQGIDCVVVLGATSVNGEFSAADRWSGEGILRVLEGVRIWRAIPKCKLVLSAGSSSSIRCNSAAMAALPIQLGVPRELLILETRAMDTLDEANLFLDVVGKDKPFALVTSALHMPRSIEIFRGLGMDPIACPCAFKTKVWPLASGWFFPDISGLQNSHLAFHEYLGKAWLSFRRVVVFCLRFGGCVPQSRAKPKT